jgi:hypothetical protein
MAQAVDLLRNCTTLSSNPSTTKKKKERKKKENMNIINEYNINIKISMKFIPHYHIECVKHLKPVNSR